MFDDYAKKLKELQQDVPKIFERVAKKGAIKFVNEAKESGWCNMEYLESMPVVSETDNVKVIAFPESLVVAINGRKGVGVVLKPVQNN